MGEFIGYRCSQCGHEFREDEVTYTCPHDGGNLDILLPYKTIKAETSIKAIEASEDGSIWRYLPLLPVQDPGHIGTPLRAVGWTPTFQLDQHAARFGLRRLWLKDDGRNPTASFKDRASAVAVARAQAIGVDVIVTASTGNAGAALAGMAAAAKMPAVILAPKTAPPAKVAQLLIFGARVVLVDGTYDDAFDLTLEASEEFGWYCRNTGYNPFTAEGKKTASFEICEQITRLRGGRGESHSWDRPDAIFVSVGDGNIISGLYKGFFDLHQLGWIESMPRIYGVQSEGSAAIYNAFVAGDDDIKAVQADTLADSISVDLPRDGWRALQAAKRSGGAYLSVSDEAILKAIGILGREVAVFAEPAGAAAYAGLLTALDMDLLASHDSVLVLNTGNGLKDIKAAREAAGEATIIEPSLAALRTLRESWGSSGKG
jgi:threonine synthase